MVKKQDNGLNEKKEQEPKKQYSLVPGEIAELWMYSVKSENMLRVKTATVFHANYPLIRDHFPDLSDEKLEKVYPEIYKLPTDKKEKAIRQKIDDWLLYYSAFISEKQAGQTMVNTPIETTDEQTTGWRPPKYGRAMVFSMNKIKEDLGQAHEIPLFKEKLLDVKGCGLGPEQDPSFETHGDGLLKLSDALIEYSNQSLIEGIFRHSKSYFKTLPMYAIIDLGFDIKSKFGIKGRAALMLRQPHRRPHNPGGLPTYGSDEQHIQLEVELLLRKYGITSVNNVTTSTVYEEDGEFKMEYGGFPVPNLNEEQIKNLREVSHYKKEEGRKKFDGINVQLTREIAKDPPRATLVDFGTYRVKGKFENPLLSLVSDKLMRWGGSIFPHFQNFPQPDKNICVPAELWGDEGDIWGYKTKLYGTKQDFFCDGLVKDYREKRLTKEQVMGRLEAYIRTATSRWE